MDALAGQPGSIVEHEQPPESVRVLQQVVRRAMARDLVGRNVVEVVSIPAGRRGGRPSRLTPQNVDDVLSRTAF